MERLDRLTYGIYVGDIEPTNGIMYWLDTSDDSGSSSEEPEIIPAIGITLDKITLTFTDSMNQTLIATVTPSNSTDTVTWESSNTSVASVKNGVVTPVANGSCTITVKAGNYSTTCEVTVDVAEEIVTLSSISATYTGGDVVVGTALTDLTGITVTVTYSDGSTANVTDYTLSGEIVEGNNIITVTYEELTTTFTITGIEETSTNPYLDDEANIYKSSEGDNVKVTKSELEALDREKIYFAFYSANTYEPFDLRALYTTSYSYIRFSDQSQSADGVFITNVWNNVTTYGYKVAEYDVQAIITKLEELTTDGTIDTSKGELFVQLRSYNGTKPTKLLYNYAE